FFGCAARIDELPGDTTVHQLHSLPVNAFSVKRAARLQRVRDVVEDIDVFAEDLFAYPIGEKGALVKDRQAAKIPEHEPNQVEYGSGFQDHRVLARRQFLRIPRGERLLRRSLSQQERVELLNIRIIRLLPAG